MLLKTRFYIPPLRPNVVRREALLQRLQDSTGGMLVLVSAPAGYGKTTLVSQWLHFKPHTFTWLSLGQEHNAPLVFWQYAITALQQILPDVGREAEALARGSEVPDYQQVIVSLLNDLDRLSVNNSSNDPVTLVLDDFHLLRHERLLGLFNLFLDHLPSCIRIVMTARTEPDLQLPKRRASGQLLQIGIPELRFSAAESEAFFHLTMGVDATQETSRLVCERTEGWIAGLQLAALSLQHNPQGAGHWLAQPGLDRHIADYLLEEVFATLPAGLQQFLVQTSIAKRFCAGLCNAITGQREGITVLATLESANLFLLPLDNHRTWFRYHDLFRQLLLQHRALLSAEESEGCVRRALQWLEQNGYLDDAVELCLEQARWDAAVQLLCQEGLLAIAEQADGRYHDWLRRLPAEIVAANAVLSAHLRHDDGATAVQDAALPLPEMIEPLTQQEKVVLELITQGLSNKAIAGQLRISINTLKVHIRNLYGKMGVENRTQVLLRVKNP